MPSVSTQSRQAANGQEASDSYQQLNEELACKKFEKQQCDAQMVRLKAELAKKLEVFFLQKGFDEKWNECKTIDNSIHQFTQTNLTVLGHATPSASNVSTVNKDSVLYKDIEKLKQEIKAADQESTRLWTEINIINCKIDDILRNSQPVRQAAASTAQSHVQPTPQKVRPKSFDPYSYTSKNSYRGMSDYIAYQRDYAQNYPAIRKLRNFISYLPGGGFSDEDKLHAMEQLRDDPLAVTEDQIKALRQGKAGKFIMDHVDIDEKLQAMEQLYQDPLLLTKQQLEILKNSIVMKNAQVSLVP